jgi:hypothetical protein
MDAPSKAGDVRRGLSFGLPQQLPNLRGSWLTGYSVVWFAILAIALFGIFRGAYIELAVPKKLNWSPYGFTTSLDSNGFHVAAVSSTAAKATRLASGDDIIAVDDWVIPHTETAYLSAGDHLIKPYGQTTTFTARKPSGEHYKVELTRSRAAEEQWYVDAGMSRELYTLAFLVPGLVFAILFAAAACLLFLRRRHETVPAILSLGFLMIAPVAFDAAWNAWTELGIGVGVITVFAVAGWILVFAAFLAFPSGRLQPRWTAVCLLLLPLLFLFYLAPKLVGDIAFSTVFLLCLAALVSRYRQVSGSTEGLQLRWVFFGFCAGGLLVIAALLGGSAVMAAFGNDPRWGILSVVGSFLFYTGLGMIAAGLLVSILRFRLYDADAVIGRSAAYAVLTLGFVALFAASQKIIEQLGEEYLGQGVGALAGGVAAALAALAVAPMHARVQRWAERRFQRGLHRLRHGLPALVSDLRETSGLDSIAGATLDNVVKGVHARAAALVVRTTVADARGIAAEDAESWLKNWTPATHDGLDCDRSDPVFPLRAPLEAEGHGRIGWLLVGPRPDGSFFGGTERAVLEDVTEPVARAIQVALMREEREAGFVAQFASIEGRIESIESRLSKLLQSPRLAGSDGH